MMMIRNKYTYCFIFVVSGSKILEAFRCKAQTCPHEVAVVSPLQGLSGLQSRRALWEKLSAPWPRTRHLHSCCAR